MHRLVGKRVFRGSEVVNCDLLGKTNLTASETLSRRALNWKPNKLEKQMRRRRKELPSKKEKLDIELETAIEAIARLEKAVRGY